MFKGSIVALVTPFRNGKIDVEKLDELVEFHVAEGTNAIVPCGTTGESAAMSHSEHEEVIKRVVRTADGRLPVIAGTGSNYTDEAISLTRFAADVGADAALLVSPYYNRPTQEGLYRHFRRIAEEVNIPQILYNVPSRTGSNVLPSTVLRLADLRNVVAIKEASGSVDQSVEILRGCDIDVLSGDDSLTLPLMAVGATGVISVAANLVPRQIADLTAAMLEGNVQEARRLHMHLYPLFDVLFVETNPIPVKSAMAVLERIGPEMRLPLCEMAPANLDRLKSVLADLGIR